MEMSEEMNIVRERLAIDFSEKLIKQPGAEREKVKKAFMIGFKCGYQALNMEAELDLI